MCYRMQGWRDRTVQTWWSLEDAVTAQMLGVELLQSPLVVTGLLITALSEVSCQNSEQIVERKKGEVEQFDVHRTMSQGEAAEKADKGFADKLWGLFEFWSFFSLLFF